MSSLLIAASTVQAVGLVIALTLVAGFVVYAAFNVRAGREEVGSEIELAANLKPYLDDDELETTKLDRTLTFGLLTLAIVGIGLPAYWLAEPGRQEGAIEEYDRVFITRGEEQYVAGSACNACHGPEGVGGVAPFTILDDNSEFVAQVEWKAPALNNVMLRYDREEVKFILDYGRAYSPMPAWGAAGGGPRTEQEIENIIDYLESIQITSEESITSVEGELVAALDLSSPGEIDYSSLETGEALFNLGRDSGFAGGAYACGRCHTRGWSISRAEGKILPEGADVADYIDYPDGAGGYGPRLEGIIPRQFAAVESLVEFLTNGAERGVAYGNNGLSGDGMMPGFGVNPNTDEVDDGIYPTAGGMLSEEMIQSIARYVESLDYSDTDGANEEDS
ncbi:c-type cytochrome [Actinospongicola halichondriae]|uniref:c-type cytochrome n=1 Tax=Actinospongicola halichondriae TaxID=3236844 RepID=UPI003D43AD5D